MTLWSQGRKFIAEHIAPAMENMEKIKQLIYSPGADLAVKLFPGTWDDMGLAWLRSVWPQASAMAGIVATCVTEDATPAEVASCIAAEIAKLPESERPGVYRDLVAYMALEKAKLEGYEHDLELSDVNLAIELQYIKEYKDKEAA